MKELNLNDLDQVSGGMENPYHEGVCEECEKKGQVLYVPNAEPTGKNLCAACGKKYFEAQNYKTDPVTGI